MLDEILEEFGEWTVEELLDALQRCAFHDTRAALVGALVRMYEQPDILWTRKDRPADRNGDHGGPDGE